jgi:hypothetical protein
MEEIMLHFMCCVDVCVFLIHGAGQGTPCQRDSIPRALRLAWSAVCLPNPSYLTLFNLQMKGFGKISKNYQDYSNSPGFNNDTVP